MNKIYDKLLLAVSVLLLAGGVALYMQHSGEVPEFNATVSDQPADNPYQAVPVISFGEGGVDANWPEVEAQPSGPLWIYDVFTPPKIYIDTATGEFTPEPPIKITEPTSFGVYLAEIKRKPYRIQLEGYIEEPGADASRTLLLMYDEEALKPVRARVGDVKPGSEFKLIDFDIERIRDPDGSITVHAEATIYDQRADQEVVLKHGERRYEDGVTIVIKSRENPNYIKELTEAGESFEGPIGQYTLLEINLEDSSVLVEKQGTEEQEAKIKTLTNN